MTTRLGDRYALRTIVGRGGMATVWRAVDEATGAAVAIKLADASADPDGQRVRLAIEAATLRQLRHPNIIGLRDVGVDVGTGALYLVMDLAQGTIAMQAAGCPASAATLAAWGVQVLAALAVAHAAGVVHRDVKPANVLVDTAGDALLADFGVARTPDGDAQGANVVGTPTFMAPEQQVDPGHAGPAADLHAVGSTLYAVLTRRTPRDLCRVSRRDPRWEALPFGLREPIFRATRARPRDRFADARSMAASLAPAVAPEVWIRQRHLGAWLAA